MLSRKNKNAELVKKKAVYEEFGVKEYFIGDPSDKSVITYLLNNEKYAEQPSQKERLASKLSDAEISF